MTDRNASCRNPRLREYRASRHAPALKLVVVLVLCVLVCFSRANAEESSDDELHSDTTDSRFATDQSGPIYSADDRWVGSAIIVIIGLFVAAAVAGPIVRSEMPETVPPAMSHEEDPAVDRH